MSLIRARRRSVSPVTIALHHGFFREQHSDRLAGIKPKDTPLSQSFDFSLLQQILKEGR